MRFSWTPPLGLVALLASSAVADEGLSRVEIGRIGKASTALVECTVPGGKVYGSAFCVHPAGLFVTNERTIDGALAGGSVNLVLNPSLKTERVVPAKVVRSDMEENLAVLRVDGVKDLSALTLGSSDSVSELMDLVVVGFHSGAVTGTKSIYPPLSINVETVNSLTMKDGLLFRIEMNAATNSAISGGPALDKNGKVLGVKATGDFGGAGDIIPVDRLTAFLARPDVEFAPPRLSRAAMGQPAEFRAKVEALLPSEKPLAVELVLTGEDGKERTLPMEKGEDSYRVKAVALPVSDKAPPVHVTVTYANGAITGDVADRAVKAGGKEVQLSEVRGLLRKPASHVVFADGRSIEGTIDEPAELEVTVGETTVRAPLASATAAQFERVGLADTVASAVVVRQDGKEVARVRATLSASDGPRASRPDAGVLAIRPPALDEDKVVRMLPSSFDDVAAGGAGRFLIFHLPKERKLAVFDVNQAKVVFYLPLDDDNVKFAAGRDKLLVWLSGAKVLQRWSLVTFQREAAAPPPFVGDVKTMLMGSASEGPLLMNSDLVDVDTLKPLTVTFPPDQPRMPVGDNVRSRVSADGKVFGFWRTDQSPTDVLLFVLIGKDLKRYGGLDVTSHVAPGPDGRVVFAGRGLLTPEGTRLEGDNVPKGEFYSVPADHGTFYLTVRMLSAATDPSDMRQGVNVFMLGHPRPFAQLPQIEFWDGMNPFDRDVLATDRRIHFVPDAKVIITLPPTNDRLVLYRFDPEAALVRSGLDYLFVTSEPPATAKKGELYTYQLAVRSRKGGVKYHLESGPEGMEVSKDGQVAWKVPLDWNRPDPDVLLSITDDGQQECFHSFKIGVTD